MPRIAPQTVGEVRKLATEVGSNISPLAAAKLIVGTQIETPYGLQSKFLLVPTAVTTKDRMPNITTTTLTEVGDFASPRIRVLSPRGGIKLVVRATSDPLAGTWAVSDPNVPAQRMKIGGAGVTDANVEQLDLGAGGWRYDENGLAVPFWHEIIAGYAQQNPDAVIGHTDVIENDGTFVPMPGDEPGHYISSHGQTRITTFPVLGRNMLAQSAVLFS